MLKNFNQGLLPYQKHFLYRTCILLITLYRSSLWHYNKVPLSYQLKELGKMQQQVVLWILDTFHTSTTLGIKAITGLIPIYLY